MARDGLTPKQEGFTQDLFLEMSQREAYIRHYSTGNKSLATIDANASRLANNAKVKARLLELHDAAASAKIATVTERKEILSEIARAKLSDFINADTDEILIHNVEHNKALSEYTITYTKTGDPKKTIKLRDPISAISELNRMEKVYEVGSNTQVNILNVNVNELTDEQLAAIALGVAKKEANGE